MVPGRMPGSVYEPSAAEFAWGLPTPQQSIGIEICKHCPACQARIGKLAGRRIDVTNAVGMEVVPNGAVQRSRRGDRDVVIGEVRSH